MRPGSGEDMIKVQYLSIFPSWNAERLILFHTAQTRMHHVFHIHYVFGIYRFSGFLVEICRSESWTKRLHIDTIVFVDPIQIL
jgi:hypothetical protein